LIVAVRVVGRTEAAGIIWVAVAPLRLVSPFVAAGLVLVASHGWPGQRGIAATSRSASPEANITTVPGIQVGHFTLTSRPTGCTVVLAEAGAIGAVEVRGGAPGTRETDLLAPQETVQQVHAVVLAGGSAFGLDAATGVMKFLNEKKIGYPTSGGPVPIVPAAILFDLNIGGHPEIRPDATCGYEAARAARGGGGAVEEGSVGAGAGATIGKLLGASRAMKGGIGTSALVTPDGLIVGAIVAVNAVGTVVDPHTGRPIAGVRTSDGTALEDPFALVRRGLVPAAPARENTTIGVVATNARLTKAQALKVVQMAHDGLARAIVPSHTPADGDTLFVLATGSLDRDVNLSAVGTIAAEVVADSIVRAVRAAHGLPGYPAAADLR
jgi:L-aminopeptidase/D-esterase-like protein